MFDLGVSKKERFGGATELQVPVLFLPPHVHQVDMNEELFDNKTNLQNKGLISVDRGTKATLIRTIPSSLFKSYTKDLLFPIFELVFQHRLRFL